MDLPSSLPSKLLPSPLAACLRAAALWGPSLPWCIMGESLSLGPQPEGPLSPRGPNYPRGWPPRCISLLLYLVYFLPCITVLSNHLLPTHCHTVCCCAGQADLSFTGMSFGLELPSPHGSTSVPGNAPWAWELDKYLFSDELMDG